MDPQIIKKYLPAFHDHVIEHGDFLSSTDAAAHFGITNDYVTLLCRRKKVTGFFIGRLWFVQKESLKSYLSETEEKKHRQREALSQRLREEYRIATS